ncbi:MAG: thermonuclease family protein [Gammaproteobacteria bacterium SHHR-1]|uniref:thermonuclease family protein n=1 Tax=Magnetovirga frankeli TaxID=947516 RepID=UPI001292CFF0|nr:thermonuclease family protein [gamma proteobacterium SS-5]
MLNGVRPLLFLDRDRYGRTVAELIDPASGHNINRQMVEQGQAAVYRRYCPESGYRQAEQEVKRQGLGVWRQAGDWQRPWAYRQ